MRKLACIAAALALLPPGAGSAPAIVAVPPQIVGPQTLPLGSACAVKVTTPGGATAGPAIPIPALRLGAPVERNAMPFPTGGGGTSNAAERMRRKQAGLQYDPITFDPAGPNKPSVFAVERTQVPTARVYQHFPVKTDGKAYAPNGMIFAQALSRTTGQIVSLALLLPAKPAAVPRLTIAGARPMSDGCKPDKPIQVYASAMTAPQVRRLFSPSGCNWNRIAECSPAERPRGRVLFVQQQGASYEYRWVDYDMLAGTPPGKATRR